MKRLKMTDIVLLMKAENTLGGKCEQRVNLKENKKKQENCC